MADIISSIIKMNDLEVSSDSPLSEALLTKYGANINGLIDRTNNLIQSFVEINSSTTWTCPSNVNWIYIECAGGGGGGSRQDSSAIGGGYAGGFASRWIRVQPGQVYSVIIGAGGNGATPSINNPTAGGASSFARAGVTLLIAGGGAGGGYKLGGASPNTYLLRSSPSLLADLIGNIYDGGRSATNGGYGGQAGAYGSGTHADDNDNSIRHAAANSGAGGGASGDITPDSNDYGANGGSGRLVMAYFAGA